LFEIETLKEITTMTQIIEGKYDVNGQTDNEQLEQAVDAITNDYRANVEVPAATKIQKMRASTMDAFDSLFTPNNEAERAIEDQMIQDARERGYVKHEGDYTYIQTPKGSVMHAADGETIVRLG
jgi:hypothetical protein